MGFRHLLLGLPLLLASAAFAPDAAAQSEHEVRMHNAIEGAKRGALSGAVKGAIFGAVAGAVGTIRGVLRARSKPEDDRNLKEPGRPYF